MKYVLSIILLFTFLSCKSRKDQNANAQTAASVDSSGIESRRSAIEVMPQHRLSVSFISIGSGVSRDGLSKLEQYLDEQEKIDKVRLARVYKSWGREGEIDVLFSLDELSAARQSEFIRDLKSRMQNDSLVQVEENRPARTYPKR
jgi:hypothetical protein